LCKSNKTVVGIEDTKTVPRKNGGKREVEFDGKMI